jgi:hypothetical protein
LIDLNKPHDQKIYDYTTETTTEEFRDFFEGNPSYDEFQYEYLNLEGSSEIKKFEGKKKNSGMKILKNKISKKSL